jgi:hypothetical protein
LYQTCIPIMASSADDKPSTESPTNDSPSPQSSQEDEPHLEASEDGEHTPDPHYNGQPPLPDEEAPPLPEEEVPPLPDEEAPPLPNEAPPLPDEQPPDDGWEPVWDANAQAFYFFNRFTKATQWENPRITIDATSPAVPAATPGLGSHDRIDHVEKPKKGAAGGYNPAIHGDYDPSADYAQAAAGSDDEAHQESSTAVATAVAGGYAATGTFNRFTGKWQASTLNPENHNDENKSKRQMNAFFDVDAAANSHDGRSLKAERQNKKFSRQEIKAFKDKRRERKEEKRRAWLMD